MAPWLGAQPVRRCRDRVPALVTSHLNLPGRLFAAPPLPQLLQPGEIISKLSGSKAEPYMAPHCSLDKILRHGALHGAPLTPGWVGVPPRSHRCSVHPPQHLSRALGFLLTHLSPCLVESSSRLETMPNVCLLVVLNIEGAQ